MTHQTIALTPRAMNNAAHAQVMAYSTVIALIDGMAREEDGTVSQELHTLRARVKKLREDAKNLMENNA